VESEGRVSVEGSGFDGGRKAAVCRGVFLTWREVSRGLGFGAWGDIWWIEIVEEGPEERRRG